jgi:hypothetical protein
MNSRSNDHFSKTTILQKNNRSNDLSVKWLFGQMTIFRRKHSIKWTFSQMIIFRKSFRSNEFSVKRPCAQFFSVKFHFLSKVDSAKWPFSEKKIGHMTYRQNELSVKRRSVKRRSGRINFQSNGIRSKGVRPNGVSIKWPFGQKFSVKWFFGKVIQNPNWLSFWYVTPVLIKKKQNRFIAVINCTIFDIQALAFSPLKYVHHHKKQTFTKQKCVDGYLNSNEIVCKRTTKQNLYTIHNNLGRKHFLFHFERHFIIPILHLHHQMERANQKKRSWSILMYSKTFISLQLVQPCYLIASYTTNPRKRDI